LTSIKQHPLTKKEFKLSFLWQCVNFFQIQVKLTNCINIFIFFIIFLPNVYYGSMKGTCR
jgi:hypothetical protein